MMRWRTIAGLLCAGLFLLASAPQSRAQFFDDSRSGGGYGYGNGARPRPEPRQQYYYPGQVIPQGGYEPRPYGGYGYQRPPASSYRPAPGYRQPSYGYQQPSMEERPPIQRRQARRPEPEAPRKARRLSAPAAAAQSAGKAQEPVAEPSTYVAVFGDSLAELVGAGLEEAYEDTADVDVVRKIRSDAGLVRQDVADWPKIVQETLGSNPKIAYGVMMLGANDRQPIREGDTTHEPLSDRWKELYRERVDALVKVFADRKLPLIWVGMPPMRNDKYSADLVTLNEIYRERVQKGGGLYVDIWPGFVNDENRYSPVGPDLEGASARLRTADGVHFTRAGARKAAHFAHTELKRLMEAKAGTAVAALPAGASPAPVEARPSDVDRLIDAAVPDLPQPPGLPSLPARPVAGPVVPLTRAEVSPGGTLVSGRPRLEGDAAAAERALRQGATPGAKPGRADDFRWPRS